MQKSTRKVRISSSIGEVSTLSIIPDNLHSIMILGHGAGAGMQHRFMEGLSVSLANRGIGTVRYNFPYMENKKGRPDVPAVAHQTILSIYQEVERLYPDHKKVLAGKSFGGRMSSQTAAKNPDLKIQALVFYGFPLHSPAKPGTDRAAHLFDINVPMLFLQGDRDTLARLDLLEPLLKKLPLAQLQVMEGADHSFKFLKKAGISEAESLELLARMTNEFLQKI